MTSDQLADLRTLAREWTAADTTHRDDFLRGHATGMADAGRALLERLGDNEEADHV